MHIMAVNNELLTHIITTLIQELESIQIYMDKDKYNS